MPGCLLWIQMGERGTKRRRRGEGASDQDRRGALKGYLRRTFWTSHVCVCVCVTEPSDVGGVGASFFWTSHVCVRVCDRTEPSDVGGVGASCDAGFDDFFSKRSLRARAQRSLFFCRIVEPDASVKTEVSYTVSRVDSRIRSITYFILTTTRFPDTHTAALTWSVARGCVYPTLHEYWQEASKQGPRPPLFLRKTVTKPAVEVF